MRTPTSIVLLLAASAALVGCGGQTGAPTTPAGSPSAPATQPAAAALVPAAEGTTTYPLTLTTPYGTTTLEERPERIAVVGGLGEVDVVLALGVKPVVSPEKADGWAWYPQFTEQLAEATVINPWADAMEIEAILSAKPDLIVAFSGDVENNYERMAKIAPVLGFETADGDPGDWRAVTTAVGAALDLTKAADQAIADAEQHVADVAAENPQFAGKTLAVLINRGQASGIEFVNAAGTPAEEILSGLGIAPHPNAAAFAGDNWEVSLENIGMVDGDGLLIAQHGGEGTVEDAESWLSASPLFQALNVVKEDRVSYLLPDPTTGGLDIAWSFSHPTAVNLVWTVDALNEALEGSFPR